MSKSFPPKRSPQSQDEHMVRRAGAGISHRKIAAEFNTSKSTVGRKLKASSLSQGYTAIGPAGKPRI